MKMYITIRVLLALHLTGIVIMAGTTLIDYITFKTIWKFADQGDSRLLGLLPLMAKYGACIRVGGALIIITGITMLSLEHGIWASQWWFKIKMVLVFFLVMNGLFIGNANGHKLRDSVAANASNFVQQTVAVRENLNRFYPIQLSLFFLVILISMIRFDSIDIEI
jgi:hypothetical protein